MSNLYNKLVNSIEKEIKSVIIEQFNIGNMNFDNNKQKRNMSIFNKNIIDPYKIFNKILNDEDITENEISGMDNYVSVIEPGRFLKTVIVYYSSYYPKRSLNWLNVSQITNFSWAFSDTIYNGEISEWNVSNATSMKSMFYNSRFTGDISRWDVSRVITMYEMFAFSQFNGDISNWNTGNVINMGGMFFKAQFNNDISDWDVSNVEDMSQMFCESEFNQDISRWNVYKVIDMTEMFYNNLKFNQDISDWQIKPNCYCGRVFANCYINQEYKPKTLNY